MVGSLQNFGVPLGTGQVRGGILMPKVKNRFRVTLQNFGATVSTAFTQQVTKVSRPNVSFDPQEVHSYNSIAYYAGKAKWETVTVAVRDDMSNKVARLVGQQLQRQMNFFSQNVPGPASAFKFAMVIDTMDGGEGVVEQWTYEGCFLSQTNYEEFDYSSSDAMTIEMTVRFDNAMQTEDLMPTLPTLNSPPGNTVTG